MTANPCSELGISLPWLPFKPIRILNRLGHPDGVSLAITLHLDLTKARTLKDNDSYACLELIFIFPIYQAVPWDFSRMATTQITASGLYTRQTHWSKGQKADITKPPRPCSYLSWKSQETQESTLTFENSSSIVNAISASGSMDLPGSVLRGLPHTDSHKSYKDSLASPEGRECNAVKLRLRVRRCGRPLWKR